MSADFFLDTNVLVYTFDRRDDKKRDMATRLVEEALATGNGAISYQVVQEFLNVALRKFERPFDSAQAALYLNEVLNPLCAVYASSALYARALSVQDRWRFGFYDSLIVAGALETGCRRLFSEDLQHGQEIETLTVVNPFARGDGA